MPLPVLAQIDGLHAMLDRLERHAKRVQSEIGAFQLGKTSTFDADVSEAEIEGIEALVEGLSLQITGEEPLEALWERQKWFVRRLTDEYFEKYPAQETISANRLYYQHHFLVIWVQKTRAYLTFLLGVIGPAAAIPQRPAEAGAPYDVALSFAGDDRVHARQLAQRLRDGGFRVFYDEYEQAALWGKDLYVHLSDVYRNRAAYCVMFVSEAYARSLWTNHERRSAQARAFAESREYILPLRLDDTEIPGVLPQDAYLDLRKLSISDVFDRLKEKLDQRS